MAAMDTMFGGFRTRADATYKLLQAPGTAFLVVATPERDALREAAYFVERLAAERMPLAGLVLNRVHGSGAAGLSAERARAAAENLDEGRIVDQGDGKTGQRGSPATDLEPSRLATAAAPSAPVTPAVPAGSEAAPTAATDPAAQHADAPEARDKHDEHNEHDTDAHRTRDPHDDTLDDAVDVRQLTAGLLHLHAERMRVLAREQHTRDRFTARHPEVAVVK